jgi:hypothetical protein
MQVKPADPGRFGSELLGLELRIEAVEAELQRWRVDFPPAGRNAPAEPGRGAGARAAGAGLGQAAAPQDADRVVPVRRLSQRAGRDRWSGPLRRRRRRAGSRLEVHAVRGWGPLGSLASARAPHLGRSESFRLRGRHLAHPSEQEGRDSGRTLGLVRSGHRQRAWNRRSTPVDGCFCTPSVDSTVRPGSQRSALLRPETEVHRSRQSSDMDPAGMRPVQPIEHLFSGVAFMCTRSRGRLTCDDAAAVVSRQPSSDPVGEPVALAGLQGVLDAAEAGRSSASLAGMPSNRCACRKTIALPPRRCGATGQW